MKEYDISGILGNTNLLTALFPSVMELVSFCDYAKGQAWQDIDSFVTTARMFLKGDAAKESVLERFRRMFEVDKDVEKLCMQIYWSIDGVLMTDSDQTATLKLLQSGLVKLDDTNTKLIPYHDWYRTTFRSEFLLPTDMEILGEDIYTSTARILRRSTAPDLLKQSVEQIQQWKEEGRYYAIYYVLEGIFETEQKDILRKIIDTSLYFKLYFCYGYSVANSSRSKSGKAIFANIVKETENIGYTDSGYTDILFVRMDALFELINSDYEWLLHDVAQENARKIYSLIVSLQKLGILPRDSYACEKYILTRQIEILIQSEHESEVAEEEFQNLDKINEKYSYAYEREIFRLRYAESLYFRDTARAATMIEECRTNLRNLRGADDKFYLWSDMDYAFLQFVLNKEANVITMQDTHNALKKDCFNDYRKRIFALASIYYASGLKSQGDQVLFSDVFTIRELRPRQKAFYSETLALHYALSGDAENAMNELQKAGQIFQHLPSYLKIIQHNLKVLQSGMFCNTKLAFCVDGNCVQDYYCIDPRCIW